MNKIDPQEENHREQSNKFAYQTQVAVNLSIIKNNLREISKSAGRPLMAVVKANAYGHGIKQVALAALESGCSYFAVARIEEAFDLRAAGISAPILVMGFTPPQYAALACAEDIRVTVHSDEQISAYQGVLATGGKRLKVHAKIDTGMGRLGVFPEYGVEFLAKLWNCPFFDVEGIFTHLSCAEQTNSDVTRRQLQIFDLLIDQLCEIGLRPSIVHAANSAGALFVAQACKYDYVRAGISMYGLNPGATSGFPANIRPALKWTTGIISVKEFPRGQGISYGHRYKVEKDKMLIGVIPVGYADGFRRIEGNKVLAHGKLISVLGNVCMDQCMIDLSEIPDARIGDEVVLIGEQNGLSITADQLAQTWHTINYEVVCGISHRVKRNYIW